LPLALAGCGVTNNGTSSAPTGPLTASCKQTQSALDAIENSAGKLSNTEWNDLIENLSGQWTALRVQLVSYGVPSSEKVSAAYSDLAGTWGSCH
jgi:hypothetical protein